jgi:hypothetical protein
MAVVLWALALIRHSGTLRELGKNCEAVAPQVMRIAHRRNHLRMSSNISAMAEIQLIGAATYWKTDQVKVPVAGNEAR